LKSKTFYEGIVCSLLQNHKEIGVSVQFFEIFSPNNGACIYKDTTMS